MKYTFKSEGPWALFQHSNKFRNFDTEQTDVRKFPGQGSKKSVEFVKYEPCQLSLEEFVKKIVPG